MLRSFQLCAFYEQVIRTNCVDCLDRTNGGQFAVAMKFLSVSLVFSKDTSDTLYLLIFFLKKLYIPVSVAIFGSYLTKRFVRADQSNAADINGHVRRTGR